MPFVRVAKKKFLWKQLMILAPLSMSGIYLATQAISSMSSRSGNSNASAPTVQTAPAARRQPSVSPSSRTGTPLNGPTGDPGDPFGGGNPVGTNDTPTGAVPIDGGLTFLLAAGLGYGAKKAYQFRSGRKRTDEVEKK